MRESKTGQLHAKPLENNKEHAKLVYGTLISYVSQRRLMT